MILCALKAREGEEAMIADKNQYLLKLLLHKKEVLISDIKNIEKELSDNPDCCSFDAAEKGSFDFEKEVDFMILDQKRYQLSQIDDALERHKKGKYGFCEICSKRIPLERLKSVPYTNLCFECQKKAERERKDAGPILEVSWKRIEFFSEDENEEESNPNEVLCY